MVSNPFMMIPPVCELVIQNAPEAVGLKAVSLSALHAVDVVDPLTIATTLPPDEEK